MNQLDREREDAALQLCSYVLKLIEEGCVPDYMIDYLQSRVARLRRLYGLDPRKAFKPREDT